MKKHSGKKAVITTAAIAAAVSLIGMGFATVKAETSTEDYPLIIQKLAETFNVSESQVQEVFVETREEEELSRLSRAVENGDIKESQIDQILAKREEVKSEMEKINEKSLTSEERRSEVESLMGEVKTWADSNDIPVRLVQVKKGAPMGGPAGDMMR